MTTSAPAWDAALRADLITGSNASPRAADEVVDLIRHAVSQTINRLLEIAGTASSDWSKMMVLMNGAVVIQAELQNMQAQAMALGHESGAPFTTSPVTVRL